MHHRADITGFEFGIGNVLCQHHAVVFSNDDT
jgi:hypothetical protein